MAARPVRLLASLVVSSACALVPRASATPAQEPAATLRAERLEIVDRFGRARIVLALEEGAPVVTLSDLEGRPRLRLGTRQEEPDAEPGTKMDDSVFIETLTATGETWFSSYSHSDTDHGITDSFQVWPGLEFDSDSSFGEAMLFNSGTEGAIVLSPSSPLTGPYLGLFAGSAAGGGGTGGGVMRLGFSEREFMGEHKPAQLDVRAGGREAAIPLEDLVVSNLPQARLRQLTLVDVALGALAGLVGGFLGALLHAKLAGSPGA